MSDWTQRYWPTPPGGNAHDRPRMSALREGAGHAIHAVRSLKTFLDEDHAAKMTDHPEQQLLSFEDPTRDDGPKTKKFRSPWS